MVEVGRDVLRWPSPVPLLKQGHLEQGAQDYIHGSSWISPSMETLPPPWAPSASHPPSKKVFSDSQRESPLFWFVSIASGPVTGQR